ncbi:hypothetical protein [Romboutsia ilealis]|jgi:hypothetical protein|uniref:hypothetical protein n=1 Tax=Romboutsia ilealis TaxID=1115758 RepID=UPI0027155D3E|nr:hypothetical protein [Romboutsia ilealis]MCI9140076.1 hypothetical protein [Lachnospiraceae bacterium]
MRLFNNVGFIKKDEREFDMEKYNDLAVSLQNLRNVKEKGITIVKSFQEETFISYMHLWEEALLVMRTLERMGACKGCEVVIQC